MPRSDSAKRRFPWSVSAGSKAQDDGREGYKVFYTFIGLGKQLRSRGRASRLRIF